MADTKATDVVPWEQEATGIAKIEPTAELVAQARAAILDGQLPPEMGDPAITARMIAERIFDGTLADSLNPDKLPAWSDLYLDRPVAVMGFHFNPSTQKRDDGTISGVYAVVEIAEVPSGELRTVSCGGTNVLAQLVKAWEEQAFPFTAVLTGYKTGSGRETLWLRTPEAG